MLLVVIPLKSQGHLEITIFLIWCLVVVMSCFQLHPKTGLLQNNREFPAIFFGFIKTKIQVEVHAKISQVEWLGHLYLNDDKAIKVRENAKIYDRVSFEDLG